VHIAKYSLTGLYIYASLVIDTAFNILYFLSCSK